MTTDTTARNTIIHGNCIQVMESMPTGSVDFILTDPPYIASYKSRDNKTVLNDDNAAWLHPSFAQMLIEQMGNAAMEKFETKVQQVM